MTDKPVAIAALYRFARIDDPEGLRAMLLPRAEALGIRGTLLLASEGINGTIAGDPAAVDGFVGLLAAQPALAGLELKRAWADTMPFHRLKIRVKAEIVTMGVTGLDPATDAGTYVEPADWNALVDDPDTIVIDTRNDYEVRVGTFAGAIDPGTARFSDFPTWFRAHHGDLAGKRIAMFCTGGIRCEKATAFLKAEGVDDVFHLRGGILRYLEEVPEAESRWTGECFVFDERVAVRHRLDPGTHSLCRGCRMPLSPEDRASPLYTEGVGCSQCHAARSDRQRAGYAERHRQQHLADDRGEQHVGATVVRSPR